VRHNRIFLESTSRPGLGSSIRQKVMILRTSFRSHTVLRQSLAGMALLALLSVPAGLSAQESQPLTIEADDSLEWNQTDGIYTATGNAIAIQGERKIAGNKLVATYDPDSEGRDIDEITATGAVTFVDTDIEAQGSKLIYTMKSDDYQVDGPDARVAGPRGTITADTRIILDTRADKTQEMKARGDALYRDADGRVFAGDSLDAIFDDTGSLVTIDAKGDVRVVTEGGREATSDAAIYNAVTEQAVLTGNVVVIDGESRMKGGRAEVDFKTGNSRMLSSGSGGRVSGVLVSN
jgi:lipopolysaccharide transport protein LptA